MQRELDDGPSQGHGAPFSRLNDLFSTKQPLLQGL